MPRSFSITAPCGAAKRVAGVYPLVAMSGFFFPLKAEPSRPSEDPGEWQRADIAVFQDEFLARGLAFTQEARRIAEQRLATLERESTSPTNFAVELCRIATLEPDVAAPWTVIFG